MLVLAGLGTGAWLLLADRGGQEAVSYGTPVDLPDPAEEVPEEAWTYAPAGASSVSAYPDDTTTDGGIAVRWNTGADYDSPGAMAMLDADGEEQWTADFVTASFVGSVTEDTTVAYGFGADETEPDVVEVVASGTGEPLWDTEGTFAGTSEEVVLLRDDLDSLEALDRRTGESLWAAEDAVTVSFAEDGDLVLLGQDDVRLVDGGTGEETWRVTPEVEEPGVVVAGDLVLLGSDGGTQALDLADGSTLWTDEAVTELTNAWELRDGRVLGATSFSISTGSDSSGPEDRTAWVLDREGQVGPDLAMPQGRDDPWSWQDGRELLAAGGVLHDEDLSVLTDDYAAVLPTTDGFYGVAEDGTVSLLAGPDDLQDPVWSADLASGDEAVRSTVAVDGGLLLVEGGTVRVLR